MRGNRAPLEVHAVFKWTDGVDTRLAVIGMLFRIGNSDNELLQSLIDAGLPAKKGDEVDSHEEINLADALTSTSRYYTYQGSLTTPPCSEIVTWIVLKKKAEMSQAQFEAFNHVMSNNFRPLQKRNDRVVRVTYKRDSDDDSDDND